MKMITQTVDVELFLRIKNEGTYRSKEKKVSTLQSTGHWEYVIPIKLLAARADKPSSALQVFINR